MRLQAMATRAACFDPPATAAARGRPAHGPQGSSNRACKAARAPIANTQQRPQAAAAHLAHQGACPHGPAQGLGPRASEPSLRLMPPLDTASRAKQQTDGHAAGPDVTATKEPKALGRRETSRRTSKHTDQGAATN